MFRVHMALVLCLAVGLPIAGCGGDNASEPDRDTAPPAAVTDLRVESTGCDHVDLAWTAPGDDSTNGKASFYDVRYSTETITAANWSSAIQCQSEPAPKTAGQTENFAVAGLTAGTTYYFAVATGDDAGNGSDVSNNATTAVGSTEIEWVHDGLGADQDWSASSISLSANWGGGCVSDYEFALGTSAGATDVIGWTSSGMQYQITWNGLDLADGTTYYWSVRGVLGAIPGTPTSSDGITVDITAPVSQVNALPEEVWTTTFTVTWGGSDSGSGIKWYDVEVSGDGGSSWGPFFTSTTLTSAEYEGTDGHTYHFRSRAYDIAGNVEDYPATPDAHTTVDLDTDLKVDWVWDGNTAGVDEDWSDEGATLYGYWPLVDGATAYEVAIGSSSGGADILNWYNVGITTSAAAGTLPLVEGGTYYFSVRVLVGEARGPVVSSDGITVDTGKPSSSVSTLAPAIASTVFSVAWTGSDAISGVRHYNIQVKDGAGEWQDWLSETDLTGSDYYGMIDHTYYFRSQAVDSAGNVEAYPTEADAYTCVTCTFAYQRDWGQDGTGAGDFKYPFNVAVDGLGNVYVAESDNGRVQVFDPAGNLLRQVGGPGYVDSLLRQAAGVAIDDSGYVYVTDFNDRKVKKYTSGGAFVAAWSGSDSPEGEMVYPRGITVDDSFYVYVAEQGNDRVRKFTSGGVSVKTWGGYGTADGQFRGCMGVAAAPSGDIYAVDAGNSRIQQFTSDGIFVRSWGSYGSADGRFDGINFIAIDESGHVYVTQIGDCRIQRFTPEGVFLNKWGGCGTGDGQFIDEPFGIAVHSDGTVYVTDMEACRVVKFVRTCP